MIRLSSYQRDYDMYWSGDPALKQMPPEPDKGATDEQRAEYRAAVEDYLTKLTAARETSNWSEMVLDNQVPLKFVMCQVDRNIWRTIADRAHLDSDNPRWIGPAALPALLFRLALKDIPGSDVRVVRSPAPEWDGWAMAQAEIVSVLDQVSGGIVSELGSDVLRRLAGVSKK